VAAIAIAGKRYFIRNYYRVIGYVVMYFFSGHSNALQYRNICHLVLLYLIPITVQLPNPEEYARVSLFMILPEVEPGLN